jgi:hypothetical protein
MKIRVPSVIIGSSLQAAVALHAQLSGTSEHATLTRSLVLLPESASAAQGGTTLFESPVEGEASAALTIPIQQEWDGTRKRRFRALAEKEALETASKGELEELEELSALRRKRRPFGRRALAPLANRQFSRGVLAQLVERLNGIKWGSPGIFDHL